MWLHHPLPPGVITIIFFKFYSHMRQKLRFGRMQANVSKPNSQWHSNKSNQCNAMQSNVRCMLELHGFNKLYSFFPLWCSMFIRQHILKKIHKQSVLGMVINWAHVINAKYCYDCLLYWCTRYQCTMVADDRDAAIINVTYDRGFSLRKHLLPLAFHISRSLKQAKFVSSWIRNLLLKDVKRYLRLILKTAVYP